MFKTLLMKTPKDQVNLLTKNFRFQSEPSDLNKTGRSKQDKVRHM